MHALALALGLGVRLYHLGAAPLSDPEAALALRALALARGDAVALGPQPGYETLTSAFFFLLGGQAGLARLVSALSGAALVGLPFVFRAHLGRRAALILAFALALDPGLVALSRLSGGPMLALGAGLVALAAWLERRPAVAGIGAGLGLLAGPAALAGAVALAATWILSRLTGATRVSEPDETSQTASSEDPPARARERGLLAGAATLLLAGTIFLRVPQGLGALAGTVPAYLAGWLGGEGVPAVRLLLALPVYQPLALVFGAIAGVRSWVERHPPGRALSLWALAGLGLAVLYPGRQVHDLVWGLVPLWALAAIELARYTRWQALSAEDRWVALGQTTLVAVLLAFIWLDIAAMASLGQLRARLSLLLGALGLLGLTTVLIGTGWSRRTAQNGLVWGVLLGLCVYTSSATWGMIVDRTTRAQELWFPAPATAQTAKVDEIVGDLSEWETGRRDGVPVFVTVDSPALRWVLRNHPELGVGDRVAPDTSPPIVISPSGVAGPPGAYRGDEIAWRERIVWEGALPADWLRWLVFREAPVEVDSVTLWARADLFLEPVAEPGVDLGPPDDLLDPGVPIQ